MRRWIDILNEGVSTDVELENGMTVPVYFNPHSGNAEKLARECLKKRGRVALRGLLADNMCLVWDAWLATHADIEDATLRPDTEKEVRHFAIEVFGGEMRIFDFSRHKDGVVNDNLYAKETLKAAKKVWAQHNGTELTEDAELDVSKQTEAQKIASKFAEWITPRNEETPLMDVPKVRWVETGRGVHAFVFNAVDFGMPDEYRDLYVGFAQRRDGDEAGAALIKGYDAGDRRNIYYAVIYSDEAPVKKTDLIFGVRWDHLIHELTHYLDRKRQTTPTRGQMGGMMIGAEGRKGADHYYNHPLEFNAFFQQGMYHVLRQIKTTPGSVLKNVMASYDAFERWFSGEFDYDYRQSMTEQRKRRFKKRLHALYEFLLTRWEDMRKSPNA